MSNPSNEVPKTEREKWDSKIEFYLSLLGYAIGYGNVWRFPFLCYKNGGAAFLIPYVTILLLAGIPLFFMELTIGQYFSYGPGILFCQMGKIYQGLGYSMIAVSILITIYFNMMFAWSLFYMFASFTSVLPWSSCYNDFNTPYCYTREDEQNCTSDGLSFFNRSCISRDQFCGLVDMNAFNESHCIGDGNSSLENIIPMENVVPRISSSEDFYRSRMLGVNDRTWEDMGSLRWELVGCLALAWFIIGACMIKGVKSSGKVVYVTATAPYIILTALLIRGVTLDGAYKGIEFYFLKPNMTKLLEVEVWNDAATQIFYSLGSSSGVLITLSSYNPLKNNCLRDAFTISFCNCLTSVYAGFAIFSILGFMANQLNVEVSDVVQAGSGLAFIAYPEAVSRMPYSSLWAILFFVMLVTLGIDSQFSYIETIASAVFDRYPSLRRKKALVTVIITFILFLCGVSMCLDGGVYMFELMNWYAGGLSLLVIGLIEVLVVQYGYGFETIIHNLRKDMEIHIPAPIYAYLYLMWHFITPAVLAVIVVASIYFYNPAYYGDYIFPPYIQTLGWLICCTSIVIVPIGALWAIFFSGKKLKELFAMEKGNPRRTVGHKANVSSECKDTFKYIYENKAFA